MPNLREYLDRLVNIPHKEKIGIILLIVIALVISILPYFHDNPVETKSYDYDDYLEMIKQAQTQIDYHHRKKELSFDFTKNEQRSFHLNPFPFNPNEFSYEMGKSLGLNDKQIRSIIKYLQSGGRFLTKRDFRKMYLISPEEYQALEPYILLPDSLIPITYEKKFSPQTFKSKPKIELNSADSLELLKIKGIGPYFAHKILQYRKKLGGFYNIQQLLEIKGMDSTKFKAIESEIFVNPALIQKINLNHATFDELKTHPYISYNLALSIINYRKQHGFFLSIEDLKKCKLVTENIYYRIYPYLEINATE
ncbi:MAG: helix-hairpin-helix domain-containing protein [Bacteroidales bacterium]|nr:helix-hairpin-helix domain-containing protein [Bacteroidales bacterium]